MIKCQLLWGRSRIVARVLKNAMNRNVGSLKIEEYADKGHWESYV